MNLKKRTGMSVFGLRYLIPLGQKSYKNAAIKLLKWLVQPNFSFSHANIVILPYPCAVIHIKLVIIYFWYILFVPVVHRKAAVPGNTVHLYRERPKQHDRESVWSDANIHKAPTSAQINCAGPVVSLVFDISPQVFRPRMFRGTWAASIKMYPLSCQ